MAAASLCPGSLWLMGDGTGFGTNGSPHTGSRLDQWLSSIKSDESHAKCGISVAACRDKSILL